MATQPRLSPAQIQAIQAQNAQQYNPSNVPPPGPGIYSGPYYQTNDGKWFHAPATPEGNGQFVPSGTPPDFAGMPAIPTLPPGGINIGGPGPRFNMPGSGGIGWGGEGIDLTRGDFGRPLGRRGLGDLNFTRPTTPAPTDPTTPTPNTTDDKDKDKEKDKPFDWKKLIEGLLAGGADIGSVLSAMASERARARALEATNAQNEDRLALQRAQFSLNAPRSRAGQAAYGDYLANVQDIDIDVPGVRPATITGGMRPSNLGPNARAAGTELSKQALEKLLSGEELPPLSERPEASWIDDLLNYSSLAMTGVGVYDRIKNPTRSAPNPTPLTVAGVTPGTTPPSSATGILDAGQSAAFGGNGRAVPNWFQPRVR